jgi:hypothetical protein
MVDSYLFKQQFQRFETHVVQHSGLDFTSFSANPYTELQEGYKYDIYREARKLLKFEAWRETDIGKGNISRSVIKAIELPSNNLVQWQSRYGAEKRPHHPLCSAVENSLDIEDFDSAFYSLYCGSDTAISFNRLVELFGRKYALIAYLLFLKDRSRYMPIAPDWFDKAFSLLGVSFSTRQKCSWENYLKFNKILSVLKASLSEVLEGEVSLLDAHSFAWMISKTIVGQGNSENKPYEPTEKERASVAKARNGQGYFRDRLIQDWNVCAVTGCSEKSLLVASHIKPWTKCDVKESVDPFNGLLLSPALDAAFDKGLITFDDAGNIGISSSLHELDAKALGISSSLRLSRIAPEHKPYLSYHREFVFRKS